MRVFDFIAVVCAFLFVDMFDTLGTLIGVANKADMLDKDGKLLPMPVKVGDKVIYGKFGGTEVTLDGENVLILRADDIYAVVE